MPPAAWVCPPRVAPDALAHRSPCVPAFFFLAEDGIRDWSVTGVQTCALPIMTNIYQLGLDGAVRAQWKISKIIPKGDMSGDGRIDVSPDGKRLLLSIDMGEESGRKDWDGPLPALWSFDLQSQKATRLTSKKLFGWDGVWIDNNNILFLSKAAGEKDDSIYRMSADGKNLKRLIKNGRFPSVSAPQAETTHLRNLSLRRFFRA